MAIASWQEGRRPSSISRRARSQSARTASATILPGPCTRRPICVLLLRGRIVVREPAQRRAAERRLLAQAERAARPIRATLAELAGQAGEGAGAAAARGPGSSPEAASEQEDLARADHAVPVRVDPRVVAGLADAGVERLRELQQVRR